VALPSCVVHTRGTSLEFTSPPAVLDWISRIDLVRSRYGNGVKAGPVVALTIVVTAICCRNFRQTCGIKRVLKRPEPVRL